jgi:hypothetical protein
MIFEKRSNKGHTNRWSIGRVAGFWSEIAQDEIYQMKNGLVFKKEGILP